MDGVADPTRLNGRWLPFVRACWVAVALLASGVCVAGLPVHYAGLRASTPANPGLSPAAAVYLLALQGVFTLVCLALAALLAWRGSASRVALFAAFAFALCGTGLNGATQALVEHAFPLGTAARLAAYLGPASFFILFCVFPDGRFVPRWTRWLAASGLAWGLTSALFPGSPVDLNTSALGPPFTASFVTSIAFAQVYRYWRVSGPVEQQQTKWVAVSVVVEVAALMVVSLLWAAVPFFRDGLLDDLGIGTVATLTFSLIPLSLTIAILRYRLWDIDVLIRRTLVYGALTVALALVYFGTVALLQRLLSPLLGQDNQVAIVASTLTIAALSQPLRRRIQDAIDRRFYRRRYDAAQTLADFGARLRSETDLERLCDDLLQTAEATMQPAHASLWLRPPRRDGRGDRAVLPRP